MMNLFIILSISLQIFIIFAFWFFVGRRHQQKANTYPLYSARDKFVLLVAKGKLKEEDHLFQFFYKTINVIISNSKKFTFTRFVRALEGTREKGLDPTDEKKLEEVMRALAKVEDPEIKEAVLSFYQEVFGLLVKNSPVLRIACWLKVNPFPKVTKKQKSAGEMFDRYSHARNAMIGCAA